MKEAALLVKELAGGEIASEIKDNYPHPIADFPVELSYDYVNSLVGKVIPVETVKSIVTSLEMKIVNETAEGLSLLVPPYRVDVQRPCDVVEDILRIYGYNNVEIPTTLKSSLSVKGEVDKSVKLQNLVGEQLVGCGFNEILNNSLTAAAYYDGLETFKPENLVRVMNPLSNDLNVMRATLLFGGLESIQHNANRKNADLKFFEFGNCYHFHAEKKNPEKVLAAYSEELHMGLWLTGKRVSNSWAHADENSSVYELKAYVLNIFRRLGVNFGGLVFGNLSDDIYSVAISVHTRGGKLLATFGVVCKKIQKAFDIDHEVYYADLNWKELMKAIKNNVVSYKEISKFPAVKRDLALLIDKKVQFAEIEKIAYETDKKLLKSVELFDVYEGDKLPVSAMPVDGTWPAATTQWEKRNIAIDIPQWNPELCIQCTKCATICPHAAIRAKFYPNSVLENAPADFKHVAFRVLPKDKDKFGDCSFTIQVAPEDCTGCGLCATVCPSKSKTEESVKALMMTAQEPIREREEKNFEFFLSIPNPDRLKLGDTVKDVQFRQPLFEFSGSCAGCGETPYVKTLTQLFGDRLFIANATGCSSIYGGNLPTTPYCVNQEGRGPAWANSLFEDNAEFGYGFRISLDKKEEMAKELVKKFAPTLGDDLVKGIVEADQTTEAGIAAQRERVEALKQKLAGDNSAEAKSLEVLSDSLVKKSVWILGGDGWAYDIGYGGLDHVLASGKNVNIMVMDTEVYSNTGGQMSKSTPIGAVAKFASQGKSTPKKDLGMLAVDYGNVYVAQIAIGANDAQAIKAFNEANSYEGTSLIIAYCHCISYNLVNGPAQQKAAVESGYWPLYRYDPREIALGKNPFKLDSKDPKIPVADYMKMENRFKMLQRQNPERAAILDAEAQEFVNFRWQKYKYLANR